MNQSNSPGNESNSELLELSKNRQLFRLNPFTNLIKFQKSITTWEQVMCAGYNPYYQRLEAVINIKQATGYNGNLCSNGSQEYVRFFVDFKDGTGFQDMGYTQFKVADISNAPAGPQHPLSYLAFLFIDDKKYRKFLDCDKAIIPVLRAVLSWNSIPSLNPNQAPHYGNHIDANIQLARKSIIWWKDIVEIGQLKDLSKLINPEFEIKLKEPFTEKAEIIHKINSENKISAHRTFYSTIGSKINSALDFSKASSVFDIASLDDYNIDLNAFYDFFNSAGEKADVGFEELTCVGLNSLTDRLGAVIRIKRPTGYNGNLCTNGSREHVAFWADWDDNGTYDQYLGTVSLNVHDIHNIPADGLYYTVQLPIDVTRRLRQCTNPNVIRVRAVLSWESLPSTINPNVLNHWGNYKDALVQIRPSFKIGSGIHSAIYTVGGVDRLSIDPVSHLHNAGAASIYSNRPWAGNISFHGIIDRNGFGGIIKYRLLVKKQSDPDTFYQPVSTSETFSLDDIFTLAGPYADPQTDPDGWFIYKQNPNIGLYNINNYLASWNATTKDDGAYTIRFVHTDEFNNEVIADQFTIIVFNTGMDVSLTPNTTVDFSKDIDLVIDGGDCHSYNDDAPTIDGHLRAVHPYFAWWSLDLQPASHTHGVVPVPSTRTHSFIGDNGDANAVWSLDTAPLDPCGYTVSLTAHTRVILNSSPGYFPYYGPKAVGFAKLP